jgi:hypothetical protein
MSAVDLVKIERHRQRLYEEWTKEATLSAWRKWHAPLAAFTRVIEVAAPFRPLIAKLAGEMRARAEVEIFAELRKLSDGSIITMPLEIVVGTGLRM